jgi:hypothetical protein
MIESKNPARRKMEDSMQEVSEQAKALAKAKGISYVKALEQLTKESLVGIRDLLTGWDEKNQTGSKPK